MIHKCSDCALDVSSHFLLSKRQIRISLLAIFQLEKDTVVNLGRIEMCICSMQNEVWFSFVQIGREYRIFRIR